MAQKTTVHLIDDIDGTEASETLVFALDGVSYEIDVNDEHASQIRDALASYIDAARRSGRRSTKSRATSSSAGGTHDPKAVRRWAEANKVDIPARGRIPATVLDQYKAAGN